MEQHGNHRSPVAARRLTGRTIPFASTYGSPAAAASLVHAWRPIEYRARGAGPSLAQQGNEAEGRRRRARAQSIEPSTMASPSGGRGQEHAAALLGASGGGERAQKMMRRAHSLMCNSTVLVLREKE